MRNGFYVFSRIRGFMSEYAVHHGTEVYMYYKIHLMTHNIGINSSFYFACTFHIPLNPKQGNSELQRYSFIKGIQRLLLSLSTFIEHKTFKLSDFRSRFDQRT